MFLWESKRNIEKKRVKPIQDLYAIFDVLQEDMRKEYTFMNLLINEHSL